MAGSGVTYKRIVAVLQERDAEGYKKTIAQVFGVKGKQLEQAVSAFKGGEAQMLAHLVAMGVIEIIDDTKGEG